MAKITFKAKAFTMHDMEGNALYDYIQVPQFDRKHCDMQAFRSHPKYGAYANSDLFKGILSRIRSDVFKGQALRLDMLPSGVTVIPGFLAVVFFDV